MFNIDNKISLFFQYGVTQVNPSVALYLRNSNKQQLILTTFYTSNSLAIKLPNFS